MHYIYYVASQPRTSDRLISHWRALCLLAYDNWRCSIQPEIFTHQSLPEPGFELLSTAGQSSVLTARLHMLAHILNNKWIMKYCCMTIDVMIVTRFAPPTPQNLKNKKGLHSQTYKGHNDNDNIFLL